MTLSEMRERKKELGYSYEQKIILHFDSDNLSWCENDVPKYLGEVKYSLANKEN